MTDSSCYVLNLSIGQSEKFFPLFACRGTVQKNVIAGHFYHEPCIETAGLSLLKNSCRAARAQMMLTEPPKVTTENVYCERERSRRLANSVTINGMPVKYTGHTIPIRSDRGTMSPFAVCNDAIGTRLAVTKYCGDLFCSGKRVAGTGEIIDDGLHEILLRCFSLVINP